MIHKKPIYIYIYIYILITIALVSCEPDKVLYTVIPQKAKIIESSFEKKAVFLKWNVKKLKEEKVAAYGISYGIVDGKTLNKREVVPKFMEAEGFTIRKLKEGTQYWFKVQAIYEEFAGPWSEKVEGTTGKPQPPVNFKVDKNTLGTKWFVDVSWENNPLNDERKLNIEEYRVKCWDSNNPTSKYEKTFTAPTEVSTKGVLETSGKVNYVCSVQVKTDKGTLSEVKQSGVLAFDDIEKPAVSKRSERWGTTITLTKVVDHSYELKQAISGVAFDPLTGQVTATQPVTSIIIVAKRAGYTGSVESDPIEFTRQAGSTLTFANIDVPVEYGKSGNTHTQTVTNDRVVAGDTGVVSYSISPTGAGASIDTGSGKVDFALGAIGTTFTITARKAESAKYEAQTASYQLRVQANTNTRDITKPAVSKRSESWGTPIRLTKVADHSYELKQAITGVAFDESTGQITATQPAARIIIVAKRRGYTGSVESDPIEFTRQAGSTLTFANIDVPVQYGKGNTHTQTVTNDRVVAEDTGVVAYSISPTGAGASIDTGSGKVDFALGAIGTTFTITARKAESAKYEEQRASYQLRVQANTNTRDITKPAVSKRSESWGTPIRLTKVKDHSYALKQNISGVALDKSTGQVTATQSAAGIIIVAKRAGYAGSVESDPIEFTKQAGSTLRFATANKNTMYATGGNTYTQTASNDRSGSGDIRNIEYSISPTGAGASIDLSSKVNFTPGAIGTTFTITATKAESAKYEVQTASYQLTVAKFKPANKAALQKEIREAAKAHGNDVDLNYIDTSQITDMSYLFRDHTTFNGNISKWNTSKVTNMSYMFFNATSFNQPLDNWNVSSVETMSYMFADAKAFNQSLDNWTVSSVEDMSGMFFNATSFNQSLNNWTVSSVTNMSNMFRVAKAFNQSLNGWKVSSVTDMSNMFDAASTFNQPLNTWDVSSVTDMRSMFASASAFNQPLNNWTVSSVENMSGMFFDAKVFNGNISNWTVSKVTDMSNMFYAAKAFNQSLNNWKVSKVTDMSYMFVKATAFNQPLNNWNVSSVENMNYMFVNAKAFNQNLSGWAKRIGRKIKDMFTKANAMRKANKPRWAW